MRRLLLLLLMLLPLTAQAQQASQMYFDNSPTGSSSQKVSPAFPLPTTSSGGGSAASPSSTYNKNLGVTTYTKTDVTLTGSSQTMLAASDTRNAFTVYNPSTNASVYVELSGGTAVSDAATAIPAGGTLVVTGSYVPKTAITIIGTNTQHVFVQEGH